MACEADFDVVQVATARDPRAACHAHASRRRDFGVEPAALGEEQLAKEYAAQVAAGKAQPQALGSLKCLTQVPWRKVEMAPDGPRQPLMENIHYTTMKLSKVVGFSAGSTMMGNLGQGPAVFKAQSSELCGRQLCGGQRLCGSLPL